MTSTINPYELGQARPPDGWLVSDWAHFSSIMDWSADNVVKDAGGVHLILDEAAYTWRQMYHGGEIQSDAVATTGTFTWTAQAPDMVDGAVFGMFTFQANHSDPRAEFDFEFVGGNTEQVVVVVHMAGPDGRVVSSLGRTIDLGFDASEGFHTYQTVVTSYEEAAFLVDGEVVAYFSEADMPGGAWQTRPMRSYANLWNTDQSWAGRWTGLPNHEPLQATLLGAEVQPDIYAGIGQVNGTASADRIGGTAEDEIIRGDAGDDSLSGNEGSDFLRGGGGHDVLYGGTDYDHMEGGDGNDSLYGGDGNDTLDGGMGTDRLEGAVGNDTYVLASAGDMVVEVAAGGTDQVHAAVTVTLAANVENLLLTGSAAANGTGTGLANRLTGNSAANSLFGLGGADSLYGGGGNDLLDGGTGADRLEGGGGNDLLVVDAVGDVVIELAGGGTDQVSAGITYTLGSEVENLLLTGAAALIGAGNARANNLTGNGAGNVLSGLDGNDGLYGGAGNDSLDGGAGNDTLDGGTGIDRLEGGAGNDTYVLAAAGDAVVEAASAGTDQVNASVTTTLAANVENLMLTGSAAVDGTGNGLANRITGTAGSNSLSGEDGADTMNGGDGADVLTGGLGADVLTGGAGADDFVFTAAGESGLGLQRDTIADFAKGSDDVVLTSIDANTAVSGHQAFTLDAGGAFSAGEIRQTQVGANLLVEMNTDGDADAEMSVLLSNVAGSLAASDFLLHGAAPGGTNLLVNGSFEDSAVTAGQYGVFQALPGWTALPGGRIELWNAHNGVVATNGADFAELDYAGALDGFHQDVRTTAGQSYTLTFDLRARPNVATSTQGVEVVWNGQVVATTTPGAAWGSFSVPVTGTGGLDRLTIREVGSQGADGRGALLDNFSLVAAGTPLAAQATPSGAVQRPEAGATLVERSDGSDAIAFRSRPGNEASLHDMTNPQEGRARGADPDPTPARVFTLGDLPLADVTPASWENPLL